MVRVRFHDTRLELFLLDTRDLYVNDNIELSPALGIFKTVRLSDSL